MLKGLSGLKARGCPAGAAPKLQAQPHNGARAAGGTTPQARITRRASLGMMHALGCCCTGCAARAASGMDRIAWMDKFFASVMATEMADYEAAIAPLKHRLFSRLLNDIAQDARQQDAKQVAEVLEIGMGTGPNLPYYSRDGASVHITAVDPNPYMLPYLRENINAQGWRDDDVAWMQGIAESLPIADESMDAVVCTLVLCSVNDVKQAVGEAVRVLRPGGRLLFIEHTAGSGDDLLLRLGQHVFDPLQQLLADGCHLTRDPLPILEKVGFRRVDASRFEVEGVSRLIAPHVAGIAVK
jgi:SAM-dependent methyltransferase